MEVAAANTRRVRAKDKPLPPHEAIDRCMQWFRLLDRAAVTLLPESALLDEATQLSVTIRHTLQDCRYLAAAMHLGAPLITADKPFHQRAAGIAAGHADPRTTRLYDRRQESVTRNAVEKISI